MRARLGFAIALYLKTDVLLIDEVMSVGDVPFQKKSQQAIEEAVEKGCSIVMVSHSEKKIQTWCNDFYTFNNGTLVTGLEE